ncbi:MAG TPA: hypothetical protein VNK44_05245 [Candidatus Nitrosotenuis sp.]|nr:hypothetical protein [Candidatus Nitrosotenuis sp.]
MTSTNSKKTKIGKIKYLAIIIPIIITASVFLYFLNTPAWLVIERIDSSTERSNVMNLDENIIMRNPKLKQAIDMADSSHAKSPNISIENSVMLTNTEGHNLLSYFKKSTFMEEISGNQHEFIIQNGANSYRLVIYFSYSKPLLA